MGHFSGTCATLGQPPQRTRAGRAGRQVAFKTPVMTGTCGDRNPNGARLLLDCRWGHDCYSKKSSNRAPKVGSAGVLTREEPPRTTGRNYYTSRLATVLATSTARGVPVGIRQPWQRPLKLRDTETVYSFKQLLIDRVCVQTCSNVAPDATDSTEASASRGTAPILGFQAICH